MSAATLKSCVLAARPKTLPAAIVPVWNGQDLEGLPSAPKVTVVSDTAAQAVIARSMNASSRSRMTSLPTPSSNRLIPSS